MNSLSTDTVKTFNLLSIGQRGVGKTVFLIGSYLELHSDSREKSAQQLWFDCQDSQAQENIERIHNYIVQNRQYPPPTMKATNFSFSLNRQSRRGIETLCHFHWLDIPGEICTIRNLDFRRMVSTSHGCCVFIDAYALLQDTTYLQALEEIIIQVDAIATLVHLNNLKYAFALTFTKCDLLSPGSFSRQQVEEIMQPLTTRLDALKANYQTFYSFIPIVHTPSHSTLNAQGAAAPFLWLVWELSKVHNPSLIKNLLQLVRKAQPRSFQQQQEVVNDGLVQRLFSSDIKLARGKKILGLYFYPSIRRYILFLVASIGLVGVISFLIIAHRMTLQRESTSFLTTLDHIATLRQRGQYNEAVPLMEKLVQQKPELLELRLQLAYLYELTGQLTKAETTYDQILAQQKNNFKALTGKALMRKVQGDTKTASALFLQAEQAAPADFKAQIRALAHKTP